jgi:hypothetical protein
MLLAAPPMLKAPDRLAIPDALSDWIDVVVVTGIVTGVASETAPADSMIRPRGSNPASSSTVTVAPFVVKTSGESPPIEMLIVRSAVRATGAASAAVAKATTAPITIPHNRFVI